MTETLECGSMRDRDLVTIRNYWTWTIPILRGRAVVMADTPPLANQFAYCRLLRPNENAANRSLITRPETQRVTHSHVATI